MAFCPRCGQPAQGDAFCPHCGTRLIAPAAAVPATTSRPTVDLGILVRGNWLAAGVTAVTALLAAFLASGVLLWLLDPPQTTTADRLTMTAVSTAAAFGAGAEARLTASEDGAEFRMDATGNVMPLTITVLALGLAILVFRRFTRDYPSIRFAVGDALRAAAIFAALLGLMAIVFRGDDPEQRVANAIDFEDADTFVWGTSPVIALLIGFTTMTATLLLACFVRRDWLGPRLTRLHDHLAAPLTGLGAFVALLPVVGAVAWVSYWQTATGVPGAGELGLGRLMALWISTLGTAGLAYLHGGAGARVGAHWDVDPEFADGSPRGTQTEHLSYLVDSTDAWGLWLAIPALLLVLVLTTLMVVRVARRTTRPHLGLLWWPVLMLVVMPLMTRLASARGAISIEGNGGLGNQHVVYDGSAFFGVSIAASLILALLVVPVALIIGALTPGIRLREVARRVGATASRLQQTPGAAPVARSEPREE